MNCNICKDYKGLTLVHNSDCPSKQHILCRRCHQRGHMTHTCEEDWSHWERPTSMEELIPQHIKQRYNITTVTPIMFKKPRGPDTVHELHSINEVTIPETYEKILEFIAKHKIIAEKTTKPRGDACIDAIIAWADARGIRVIPNKSMAKKNTVVV